MTRVAPSPLRRVVLESPCSGATLADVTVHVRYAHAALRDALARGEAPIASHVLWAFSGVLRDSDPEQRAAGIAAGLTWTPIADAVVVYGDFGVTRGMQEGIRAALEAGVVIEYRQLSQAIVTAIRRAWWDDVDPVLPMITALAGVVRASS